jgi:hypothetical protein
MNFNRNRGIIVEFSLLPKGINRYRVFMIKIETPATSPIFKKLKDICYSLGGKYDHLREHLKLALSKHNKLVDKIKQNQRLMDSVQLKPLIMDEFEIEFFLQDSNQVKTFFDNKKLLVKINKAGILYQKENDKFVFSLDNYNRLVEKIIKIKFPYCKLKTFTHGVYKKFKHHRNNDAENQSTRLEDRIFPSIYRNLKSFQKEGVRLSIEKNARLM